MSPHRCPEAFWDFALEYIIQVQQFLIRRASDDQTPMEVVMGETPDISEYMDFDFYQFIKYRDATSDRDDPIQLGRWLGIAHDVGTAMTYWILKENGQVICRSTVRPLLKEEWTNETEKAARVNCDEAIKVKYGTYNPELLEVFESEEIINPSSLDEENNDEQDTEPTGQCHKRQKVQVEVPDDIVRGLDLFQNAEIFYPHGDQNETK
jgi:hypothetical protein